MNNNINSILDLNELPKLQIIFCFLEYLQDLKKEENLKEDTIESLEVAIQCLSSAFEIDIQNQETIQKYSLKPYSISQLLSLGLKRKELINQTIEDLVIF